MDFFDRCAAMGQISPIPVYYLPKLCTTNVHRLNERKWLYAGKDKKQNIPPHERLRMRTTLMTYHLWPHTHPGKFLLYSLEREAGGIGLHVNAEKTEFMGFNQRNDISTLNETCGQIHLLRKQRLI